jgi:hypothetical protein
LLKYDKTLEILLLKDGKSKYSYVFYL